VEVVAMLHFLLEPWPWYVSGPLLGLMVPILLFVGNKHFGISGSLRHICAAISPAKPEYLRYHWRDDAWNLVLVAGTIVGAIVAAVFLNGTAPPPVSGASQKMFASWGIPQITGLVPAAVYGVSNILTPRSLVALGFGGFLVGFGTRYANGCTSGHAIMGLSLLSVGSLVAVIGFFVGGLVVSNLVVPAILAL
jgi:uncharacterized protein